MDCEFDVLRKAVGEEVFEAGDGVWEGVLVVFGEEVIEGVSARHGENASDVVVPIFSGFWFNPREDSHSGETAGGATWVGGFDFGFVVFEGEVGERYVITYVEGDVRVGFRIGEELVEVIELELGEAQVGGS